MGELADQYCTLRQAADALGVSKTRVEQFVRKGRLPVVDTVGGVRLVSRAAVAAMNKRPGPGRPKKVRGRRA